MGLINYVKQVWTDAKDSFTPITAARLNHMEDGIKASCDAWDSVSQAELIWSGESYLRAGQTIEIPKGISSYPLGIVLVWSAFENDKAQDYNFQEFFVPKRAVAMHPGNGHSFTLSTAGTKVAASKYVYIGDNALVGHESNKASGTGASGVKYDSSYFVLREVLGV